MNLSIYGYFFCAKFWKYIICFTLLLFFLKSQSQQFQQIKVTSNLRSLDPNTINCNGGCISLNKIIIDWTAGDVGNTIKYNAKPFIIISTGYLQNDYDASALFRTMGNFGLQIKVGPNPFTNNIHISCAQTGMDIISIALYDNVGNGFNLIKGPFSGLLFEKNIYIHQLSNPICYLKVHYIIANKYELSRTFKLIQYTL